MGYYHGKNRCENCLTDKTECVKCCENPIYRNTPTTSLYKNYIPTCPRGYNDCVCDPAYIKYNYPDWYNKLYGNISPIDASKLHCDVENEDCYDDEDK